MQRTGEKFVKGRWLVWRLDRLVASHKARLTAGVITLVPIAAVLFLVFKVLEIGGWLNQKLLEPVLKNFGVELADDSVWHMVMPTACLMLLIGATWLIGSVVSNRIIGRIYHWVEGKIALIPLIGLIYSTVKKVLLALFGDEKGKFRGVCWVQYPSRGIWVPGFVISIDDENRTVTLYIPTSPNPTSGWVVYLSQEMIIMSEHSVEKFLEYIFSCGVVTPPEVAQEKARRVPDILLDPFERFQVMALSPNGDGERSHELRRLDEATTPRSSLVKSE